MSYRSRISFITFAAILSTASHSESLTWIDPGVQGTGIWGSMLSGDGSTVVGWSEDAYVAPYAYKWTRAGGTQVMSPVNGDTGASATVVSAHGERIGGASLSDRFRASVWDAGGGSRRLGVETGPWLNSLVLATNADGSKLAGRLTDGDGEISIPFLWTEEGGARLLPMGDESNGVFVQAMSADGRRVVGRGDRSAYIWDSETTYRKLDSFTATDLSGDGRFVFGIDPNGDAVRWSDDRGLENLGTIPGYAMTIRGASYSGSTLLAEATGGIGMGVHVTLWRPSTGWVFLRDYLAERGIGTNGGYLFTPRSVSWDGNVVMGDGNRNGHRQAFVATVPEPSSAVVICLGLAALVRLRRKRLV